MTTVYYKFPIFKGPNGRIATGYTNLIIQNGYAKVDSSDLTQVELAKAHGGILNRDIPAKPAKSSKKV